jgi:acyl transferase domain-containing protein
LVAVHLACQSLWAGEGEMALAGGANLILGPEIPELFTKAGMLSPDGRCKFGDASANGFVRSEGAGIVVLKRLSRAKADGDRVYAVIRGGATNNDGRTSGLLVTPSRPGQRQMMLTAWETAGIDPARLRYIEAHGTGTGVGDPVEIGAIADALTAAGVTDSCALGSIKTNFGHTESASGVAA